MSLTQPFAPSSATYFDLIQQNFALTNDELALLARNGFVVSDRFNCDQFASAYAYLHWRDLPLLITTDSLLHAAHRGFDTLLQLAEEYLLSDSLRQVLLGCRETTAQMKAENHDPLLVPLLDDLLVYFSVPLTLLGVSPDDLEPEYAAAQQEAELPPRAAFYVNAAREATGAASIALFGGQPREIDFTLFTPRGHYTRTPELQWYFQAQSWLQQIDFRLVSVDAAGEPALQPTHLAAAMLLLTILERAKVKTALEQTEAFLTSVFGPSDNTTLRDVARFVTDAGIESAEAALSPADQNLLLHLLLSGDYGEQRISGQLQAVDVAAGSPVPRPVSLLLMGPRFIIDGLITSEVVYDRLIVNGRQVHRPLPHPLDVLYALGNDRALVHLADELDRYGHGDTLRHLRHVVAQETEHRADSLYYGFLHAIRALNVPAAGEEMPRALRGEAWQDKMLQTQLAAWTQLRHDSILYAKQSFTTMEVCSYPAGYVEPYPAFYAALADYAAQGLAVFLPKSRTALARRLQNLRQMHDHTAHAQREVSARASQLEVEWASLYEAETQLEIALLESLVGADEATRRDVPEESAPGGWNTFAVNIVMHFAALRDAAQILRGIAEKELAHQPCSEGEIQFLKDTVFHLRAERMSGGPVEHWAGWYPRLFFSWDITEPAACVADIHTKLGDERDPLTRVLHVATGRTAMAFVLVDGLDEPTFYAGPTATYYEFVTASQEAERETDETWRATLAKGTGLPVPSWTQRFRSAPSRLPEALQLPYED